MTDEKTRLRVQLELEEAEMDDLGGLDLEITCEAAGKVSLEPAGVTLRLEQGLNRVEIRLVASLFVDVSLGGELIADHILAPMFFETRGFFVELESQSDSVECSVIDSAGAVVQRGCSVMGPDCVAGGSWVEVPVSGGLCSFQVAVVKPSQLTLELSANRDQFWEYAPVILSLSFTAEDDRGGYCSVYGDIVDMNGVRDHESRSKLGFFNWRFDCPVIVRAQFSSADSSAGSMKVTVINRDEIKELREYSCPASMVSAQRARARETYYEKAPGVYRVSAAPDTSSAARDTIFSGENA